MGHNNENTRPEILLVEDNQADIVLIKEALEICGLECNINIAWNGNEALKFLRKEANYSGALTPHLVLMDLNMPIKNGLEVLAEIRNDMNLNHIPVIILTSSESDRDMNRSQELFASGYIIKSTNFDDFMFRISSTLRHWLFK
ncbi:MAG: response regulator [Ignavibacteriales bacterium]